MLDTFMYNTLLFLSIPVIEQNRTEHIFIDIKFRPLTGILPQNALRRDCNGKCIDWIEGHYLEVVVLL